MNLYTYTNEFIQKELEMFFSDTDNDFTHALYTMSQVQTGRAEYSLTLEPRYNAFSDELTPARVFRYVTQVVDDVKEVIMDSKGVDYKWWNDVVFSRDTTFDTSHFDAPVPDIIFKSNGKVGSLGKVLLCLSGDKLSLRDLQGRIYSTNIADINALNNGRYSYRSLNLGAMPQAYFDEDNRLRDEDESLWSAHEDNVEEIEDIKDRLDETESGVLALNETVYGYDDDEEVHHNGIVERVNTLETDDNTVKSKVNEMYPRVVGDNSLLSENYRKTIKNQVDIFDMNLELYGGTDPQTQEEVEGDIPNLQSRVSANETAVSDHETRVTANRADIDDILGYPEFNMTGIPPFYLFRRGDFSTTNRAYDPILWEDVVANGAPASARDLAWLHVAEKRIKEMPMRLMKDPDIKASAERICREANENNIIGNRIELGCYLNNFKFFASDIANWTPSSSYTEKQIMCSISIVPMKWQGNPFKPGISFIIMTGHLDGGSAVGDCTGAFALMDKSETDVPDYHWYRYGDTVNINGSTANVKVQYH